MEGSTKSRNYWVLPFSLLVLSVTTVPLLILDQEGLPRYRKLKVELHRLEEQNVELRREVEKLRKATAALKEDPSAIEKIARDELGMVKQNEIIVQF